MRQILNSLVNLKFIFILFLLLAAFATLQLLIVTQQTQNAQNIYTEYNNYIIFKQSFFHLIHGQDLYVLYVSEQWDLFKYSPAFAALFGVLAYLPDWLGLFFWNFLNAFVLLIAIYQLPNINLKQKSFMLLFLAVELMTSMQYAQSNGLMAGLLILAFCMLEKENILLAALFLSLTVFIKIFGIVACVLFVFYPKHFIKIVLYMIFWCLFFALVPALFCGGFEQLLFLYKSWFRLLANDHSGAVGFSVSGVIQTWFHTEPNKLLMLLTGVVLLLLPLLKIKQYAHYTFRLSMLASVLIWIIIFNHKAESPTFVIAVSGVAIWFFMQQPKKENSSLLLLVLLFTCLGQIDVFPEYVRREILYLYMIKPVPCILVWLKISYDLLSAKNLKQHHYA
ncbi:MAG: DUF2029 domain-containing protein [Bacteroidetes bacterium]|nr:DUF2029 domain-containing protein [Bacteroidota bacterium]